MHLEPADNSFDRLAIKNVLDDPALKQLGKQGFCVYRNPVIGWIFRLFNKAVCINIDNETICLNCKSLENYHTRIIKIQSNLKSVAIPDWHSSKSVEKFIQTCIDVQATAKSANVVPTPAPNPSTATQSTSSHQTWVNTNFPNTYVPHNQFDNTQKMATPQLHEPVTQSSTTPETQLGTDDHKIKAQKESAKECARCIMKVKEYIDKILQPNTQASNLYVFYKEIDENIKLFDEYKQGTGRSAKTYEDFMAQELKRLPKDRGDNLCDPKNRPQWVSQSSISSTGMVSAQNFMYTLDQSEFSAEEKKEHLKWFFEQRKFPPFGTYDTYGGGGKNGMSWEEKMLWEKCPTDENGYATTKSAHDVLNAVFIQSSLIKEIYPCKDIEFLSTGIAESIEIPVGIYEDGKKMIQQQGTRGCVAACAAMLIEDRGQKCDVRSLSTTNLAQNKDAIQWIKAAGLPAEEANVDIDQLKTLIEQHGSVSVGISDKPIGIHQIIVDAIKGDQVEIRDPNHGWRIDIPLAEFLRIAVLNGKIDCVYIPNQNVIAPKAEVNTATADKVEDLAIQYGFQPNKDGVTPLEFLCDNYVNIGKGINKDLLKFFTALTEENKKAAEILLHRAAEIPPKADIEIIRHLLKIGVDINTPDNSGSTINAKATLEGDYDLLDFIRNATDTVSYKGKCIRCLNEIESCIHALKDPSKKGLYKFHRSELELLIKKFNDYKEALDDPSEYEKKLADLLGTLSM